MPKELNFFDTNPVAIIYWFILSVFSVKKYPSGIEAFIVLCVSKCYSATSTARKPLLLFGLPLVLLNANSPALAPLLYLPPRMKNGLLELGKLE